MQEPFRSHIVFSWLLYQQQGTLADPWKCIISVLPTPGNIFPHDGTSFLLSLHSGHLSKVKATAEVGGGGQMPPQKTIQTMTQLLVPLVSLFPIPKIYVTPFAWLPKRREHAGKGDGWRRGEKSHKPHTQKPTQTEKGETKTTAGEFSGSSSPDLLIK